MEKNKKVPEIYGDPALLLSLFYTPKININLKKVTKKFIPKNNFQYQWVKVSDVENIALPKPIKKVIKNHGKENPL